MKATEAATSARSQTVPTVQRQEPGSGTEHCRSSFLRTRRCHMPNSHEDLKSIAHAVFTAAELPGPVTSLCLMYGGVRFLDLGCFTLWEVTPRIM
jgi:hypothetical protein